MPIHVVVMNHSLLKHDEVQRMLPAFERQANHDLAEFWNVQRSKFEFVSAGPPPKGAWWLIFLNDTDQAADLAYHDLTNEGLPLSKVFVKTLLEDKASVSVGATHEICEMLVDPWLTASYQNARGTFWAAEVADPVEDDQYGYEIDGVLVTDFVTPSWFGYEHAGTTYDFKGHAKAAFEVLSAGYAQKYEHNRGWIQDNGTEAAKSKEKHVINAARGTRRDRRNRRTATDEKDRWQKSEVRF